MSYLGPHWRRRAFIAGLASIGGAAWSGWPHIAAVFTTPLKFEPLDDPPGFRRIAGGKTSPGLNFFVGLEGASEAEQQSIQKAVSKNLCQALFNDLPPLGVVPVAFFTDYNCPYCRVLSEKLREIEANAEEDIRITWHEWPILGSTSEIAARAALAAGMQGAYAAFHRRLMRTRFLPTASFLEKIARDIGIEPRQLNTEMDSESVLKQLRVTNALAQIFGFIGTPALVVGRTVVTGGSSDDVIRVLIRQERNDGRPPACKA